MTIPELIRRLEAVQSKHGPIEVTCTAGGVDCPIDDPFPTVYESTVCDLEVLTEEAYPSRSGKLGTRVRIWW